MVKKGDVVNNVVVLEVVTMNGVELGFIGADVDVVKANAGKAAGMKQWKSEWKGLVKQVLNIDVDTGQSTA